MTKILIEDIEKEPNKTMYYEFNEYMEEFGCDIFADLELKSLGQFIEISGQIEGKIKLICDRCLQEYEYDLVYSNDPVKTADDIAMEWLDKIQLENSK